MNLPNWCYAVAYAVGAVWLLAWELAAAWVDRTEGDTITEYTRRVLIHPLLWFVAAGFLVWGLLSTLILDGTNAFIISGGLIRQLAAPLSVHVYKVVWSNLIILAHNIWIFVIVALWYGLNPGWTVLLAVPALLLLLANGLWLGLLLGLLSARFRDIPLIAASILQVAFFITPIFWKPEMLTGRMVLLHANPFYYLVEIMRAPLLGNVPQTEHWISVLVITVLGWGIALLFFTAYRWRLAYWV